MHKVFIRIMKFISRSTVRYPVIWLLLPVLISIPAFISVQDIKLKTNLLRLLPEKNRATQKTRELNNKVSGGGGHFTVLIGLPSSKTNLQEKQKVQLLLPAVKKAVADIKKIPGADKVKYTWPVEFIKKYRLLLIPNGNLNLILNKVLGWKAEANPAGVNLLGPADSGKSKDETLLQRENRKDMEANFKHFANFDRYHVSPDGNTMGIHIETKDGISSLGKIRKMFEDLQGIARKIETEYGFWVGIGGNHRNKLDEFSVIMNDLNTTGTVSALMIVMILVVSFYAYRKVRRMPDNWLGRGVSIVVAAGRSMLAVIIVLYPLLLGLLWGFSLVPFTVESLNLITAFLLLIMFGMGIDYSIHLTKRFQTELCQEPPAVALEKTLISTGSSVLVSGLTTALSLSILAVSNFKGFSEFGLITALTTVTILISMYITLPAILILGHKIHFIKPVSSVARKAPLAGKKITVGFLLLFAVGLFATVYGLKFDFNFRNLQFDKSTIKGLTEVKSKQNDVYSGSFSPGAMYIAPDLPALDKMAKILNEQKKRLGTNSAIGRFRSIRNYSPDPQGEAWQKRTNLIRLIKEEMQGRWVNKVKDKDRLRWIKETTAWKVPTDRPVPINRFPEDLRDSQMTKDGSGQYLIGIHPAIDRKDGRNAMKFTAQLYNLPFPKSIMGPVGETTLFAEILWIVTAEVPWLVLATFAGIFILVLINLKKYKHALLVMLPLVSGIFITFGIMALFDIQLNLFSVVVIPALLGMGVDDGVHYFRHWIELKGDTFRTQNELFGPLSVTTFTTMLGYSGMMFAGHPGIQSIGKFAVTGLLVIWLTSLFLLPGILSIIRNKIGVDTITD